MVRHEPLLASLRLPLLLLRDQSIPEDQHVFIAEGTHRDEHTRIAVSSQNQPYACSNVHAAQ